MAPAPSVPVHVFCVRTNGGATAIVIVLNVVRSRIAHSHGLRRSGLADVRRRERQLRRIDLQPRGEARRTTQRNRGRSHTERGEETVRIAATPPASDGVKTTCTVQLLPLFSVAPHVVAPVEKLLAAAPVIEKPMLAMGDPPALLMVSVCGALATPGCWLVKDRLVGLTLKAGGTRPVPAKATY